MISHKLIKQNWKMINTCCEIETSAIYILKVIFLNIVVIGE